MLKSSSDTAAPKQLYRKFVETAGVVEIQPERLVVHFDKRCHNPILREAALDQPSQVIPWLRNLPVVFQYPCASLEDPRMLIDFALRKSAFIAASTTRVAPQLTVVPAPPLNEAFECMRGTPTLLGWSPLRRWHVVR